MYKNLAIFFLLLLILMIFFQKIIEFLKKHLKIFAKQIY
jgi:hypothetical protein